MQRPYESPAVFVSELLAAARAEACATRKKKARVFVLAFCPSLGLKLRCAYRPWPPPSCPSCSGGRFSCCCSC